MRVLKAVLVALIATSQFTIYASFAPNVSTPRVEEETPSIGLNLAYGAIFTEGELLPYILKSSEKYGVDYKKLLYTLEAESHFNNIQSKCHRNENTLCGSHGVREESYGIAQFHISTFPKEKALNPYLAIDEMARLFSLGEACRWTEYRKKYGCD